MARIFWSESEWNAVVANATSLMVGGMPRLAAMEEAQRLVIDKPRHRKATTLAQAFAPSNGAFDRAHYRLLDMSPAERAALVVDKRKHAPAVSAKPPATEAKATEGGIRWTTRERAVMAAAVSQVKADPAFDGATLAQLYIAAQRLALPADRQRREYGIRQAATSGLLLRQHEEGVRDGWKYPDAKDPLRRAELAAEVTPPAPPAAPAAVAAPAIVDAGAPPLSDLAGAVALFGSSMMSALERLLVARDEHVAGQMARRLAESTASLHERIGPMVQELLQVQVSHITHEVTERFRAVLHEELGGGAPAPAIAAPAAPVQAPPPTPPQAASIDRLEAPGLRIDVLGTIEAEWMQRIRDIVGAGDEVRFFAFEAAREFAPHRGRHLIVMQQGKLPRVLQRKLEATGVAPVLVRDAAGHVLRAVQELKGAAVTLQ